MHTEWNVGVSREMKNNFHSSCFWFTINDWYIINSILDLDVLVVNDATEVLFKFCLYPPIFTCIAVFLKILTSCHLPNFLPQIYYHNWRLYNWYKKGLFSFDLKFNENLIKYFVFIQLSFAVTFFYWFYHYLFIYSFGIKAY